MYHTNTRTPKIILDTPFPHFLSINLHRHSFRSVPIYTHRQLYLQLYPSRYMCNIVCILSPTDRALLFRSLHTPRSVILHTTCSRILMYEILIQRSFNILIYTHTWGILCSHMNQISLKKIIILERLPPLPVTKNSLSLYIHCTCLGPIHILSFSKKDTFSIAKLGLIT